MNANPAPVRPLLILVGTSGGTAESVAQALLMEAADHGWQPAVHRLETVTPAIFDTAPATTFLFCTSTIGAGDLPDNARPFFDALATTPRYLGPVRYGVIGLGDRAGHPATFCGAAQQVDERLQDLGAQRIGSPLWIDTSEVDSPEDEAVEWLRTWSAAAAPASGS